MNAWNQPFNAYRARTSAYPWWVTRIPLGISLLLMLPLLVAALAVILIGIVLFVALLILWRVLRVFLPPSAGAAPSSASSSGPAPAEGDGRVNVRVIGRDE